MATADRETTDREPEAPRGPALPSARLNPLLNPLLAKQLGRWAHIYYTASVDKREAAIEKLVCELEAEEAKMPESPHTAPPALREPLEQRSALSISAAAKTPGPVLVTPQQLPVPSDIVEAEPVPQEASNDETRGFATVPGLDTAEQLEERIAGQTEDQIDGRIENRLEPAPVETPAAEAVPESWQALLRRRDADSASVEQHSVAEIPDGEPASLPVHVAEPERTSAQDYRSFDDLLAKSDAAIADASLAPPPRRWNVALAVAGVMALLGGSLWFAQSRSAHTVADKRVTPGQTAQPSQARPVVADQNPAPQPQSAPSAVAVKIPGLVNHTAAATPATAKPPLTAAAGTPGGHDVLVSKPTSPAEATSPPDPELTTGMRYLQGNGVPRDSAEAARHLWQSVKQQNGSALVVLAGLYAQGDGVAKDCDQAKILLDAAARQAKSHTQGQHVEIARETLRTYGCE